ncbi:Purine-cytosine permease [Phytophthora fragariae]|uniref:Purine-cytosine permease n=1 Tax=Phytophthora fragariae TaxID=53985 RepID=A0A6A4AAX6_9STRA|nr:Purine-cytosine permease [Phytophthora fragariae]KAE9253634.1 Purine-cytosine permease [Phytophthora fragariae]
MRGAGACDLLVITGFAYAVARLIRANVAGAMPHTQELDLEKNSANSYVQFDTDTDVPVEYENGDTWYARAQRWAEKNYMEPRSIERVPEDERHDTSLINVCTMWLSPNMVMGHFAVGILGKAIYGMGVVDSMLVILFANLLGVLPVCFFSCFGPVFGLRQMVLSRFWFDAYGIRLLIHAVNTDVPGWAGIIIIAFCTFLITLFGYKVVHYYERYSWIPNFIVYLILLGTFIHSGAYVHIPMGSGSAEVSGVLSFFSVVLGTAISWSTMAADYTVYHPPTESKRKIFFATWLGLIFPSVFTEWISVIVMSATGLDPNATDNIYLNGYNDSGAGGLIGAVLIPHLGDFGRFCLVIMALSTVANNCPNVYSFTLNIKGYSHFESVLNNFMNFIAYWATIYSSVALTEHFVFRRGFGGYNVEDYNKPEKLPIGFAAIFSFLCGCGGVALGMSQTWFTGPLASHGDIGFELGCIFTVVALLLSRPVEKRVFKR